MNDTQKPDAKIVALAAFLDIPLEDAADKFTQGDYNVYTDQEANDAASDYIKESLWAFNYSFLASHSDVISKIPEKDFQAMQGKLCESFNDAIAAMLDSSFDDFVQDAIGADGRGHFLSSYDGEENEEDGFYIYRNN